MRIARSTLLAAAVGTLLWIGGSTAFAADPAPAPASPQPAADSLKPGLSVRYWPYAMHNVEEVARYSKSSMMPGQKGAPLPGLDYDDNTGKVLSSNLTQEVGAEITGFIKFPAAGKYKLATNSNDGVRVFVGGAQLIDDPQIHAMGLSDPAEITVQGGVWYPLRVLYFQRHGTWGLQLMWAPAGKDLAVVPNDAYAHTEG
ncbi:MAG TPA: PA14 domain-containing protein [Alphaproteobacteria bacterium]|nr:PA14 domain-containing protein [Alphaproteobacteria bacterium]